MVRSSIHVRCGVFTLAASILLAGCGKTDQAASAEKSGAAGGSAAAAGKAGGRGGRGGRTGQKQAVEVVTVNRRELTETLNVVGSLAANESATLRTETAGAVRDILFEEGQAVKKGQVLVKIDDSDLRAQVAQAESRFRMAESNLQRNEALLKTSFITQADFDRISNDYTAAKYDLALLTVRLNRTELKAPFDGVVNARALSPGDYITNQTVVTTIDDLSRLKIDFQVPERYQGKVNPGTKFTVTAGSVGGTTETATGEVYFVSSSIDRSTRSIQVKGTLLAPSPRLRPGMFANVEVVLEVRSGVLTVPEGAILATPNLVQVIAVRSQGGEHVVEYVPVKLGLRTRGLTEVMPLKGNLAENDRVVAAGVGAVQLFAGARVDPKPLNAEFQVAE